MARLTPTAHRPVATESRDAIDAACALQRAVMADLTLPLERNRLIALAVVVVAAAAGGLAFSWKRYYRR